MTTSHADSTGTTPPPFIHLEGVSKAYRSGRKVHLAISDATFNVHAGELVALVGPSGCGKSTLLKILAGLHGHDAGTLRIGSAMHPFDPARDIGMVFQAPLLLKWRRILDNVLLPLNCWVCRWRRRASERAICWLSWEFRAAKTSTRTNCPAACSNARRLRGPSSTTRNSC